MRANRAVNLPPAKPPVRDVTNARVYRAIKARPNANRSTHANPIHVTNTPPVAVPDRALTRVPAKSDTVETV